MGNVKIADRLFRKSVLRDLSGNIRNWRDDENGGWIVKDYQIVNQARIDELAKIEEDRRNSGCRAPKGRTAGVGPSRHSAQRASDFSAQTAFTAHG